jgi:hypothetical protein
MLLDGKPVSAFVESAFTRVSPQPATSVTGLMPGLKFEYYEGDWKQLPDFDRLVPVKSGIAGVNNALRARQEKYGLRFTGFISVPDDAVYLFSLNSDDGSGLYIDGRLFIENDWIHSAVEEQNVVPLSRGPHTITVAYFNGPWEGELGLLLAVAGRALQPPDPLQLSHIA